MKEIKAKIFGGALIRNVYIPYNERQKKEEIEMLNRNVRNHIAEVDKRISFLLEDLKEYDSSSEDYQSIVENIKKLTDVRDDLKNGSGEKWLKMSDIVALVTPAFGLVGIVMITNHEKTDIVTSKAASIAMRLLGR